MLTPLSIHHHDVLEMNYTFDARSHKCSPAIGSSSLSAVIVLFSLDYGRDDCLD